MRSQQPPGVVQNWSTPQCNKQNTEQCGYDNARVTRGRMQAQFPLPHGPRPVTIDKDPPRGDPSQFDVPACALRLGSQDASASVPDDNGTPNDACAMHLEGGTKEAIGTAGTLGEAQQSLRPPTYPPASTPMTADQDPRRGDPSGSDVPACAL